MSLKSGVLFIEHNSGFTSHISRAPPTVTCGYWLSSWTISSQGECFCKVTELFASLWTTVMFLSCWFSALDCHCMCKEMGQLNNTRTTTFQPVVLMEFTNSWVNAVSGCSSCLKNYFLYFWSPGDKKIIMSLFCPAQDHLSMDRQSTHT